ncbi:hypothetical protein [Fictibacillus barbaricus]|uniref:Uncharacterized protein n=1 Tax=Fictibacillus barbaricus TaxID=182136 RepID=A0ABS2ZJ72_9BACL|nr:hypothetical protein [Fictibacillus barbaricus]MBN3546701.1 hypothetical protein [Fictibacillus barbaricus]GGB43124.1 hypothetical protein GCM10007199_05560 [Fictibacillus barbaricus]
MNTKEFKISHGWTIIAHENISIYSKIDGSNPNQYVLLDWDGDAILQVFTDDFSIYLEPNMYGLKHKVNAKNKIITIFHEPDEDE